MIEAFGPYLLLRVLGRGGMGVVYVARSRLPTHPVVALKRLRADAAQVDTFRQRFEHECDLALRLHHPRVVRVLDAGKIKGVPYIASELILGKDVGEITRRCARQGRSIPINVVVRIIIDLLTALDYVHHAHESGGAPLQLVHRDITPTNVLLGYDGVSRLADFGLAKSLCTEQALQLTGSEVILGTPKFMAPEVARGRPADQRSDLYGVGAVSYRMLVGCGPYEGGIGEVFKAVLTQPPTPMQDLQPDLPKWLLSQIERLMARDPLERPSSAREAGLMLVEEARRHGAILSRVNIGLWLQGLFYDECTRQTDEFLRDREVDLDLTAEGHGTRAFRVISPPLEGPTPQPIAEDQPALPATAAYRNAVRGFSTRGMKYRLEWPESTLRSTKDSQDSTRPMRPNPHRGGTTVLAEHRTAPAGRVAWMIAPLVLAFGIIGLSMARVSTLSGPRFAAVERLGGLQRAVARLRSEGVTVPRRIELRIDRVRDRLIAGTDLAGAQVELQAVDVDLQLLADTGRCPRMTGAVENRSDFGY